MDLLTLADVEAARDLLATVVKKTPLIPSRPLGEITGVPVWLKCENQQRAGSYKVRGAYTRIARLSGAERSRGVVAASAGNHAQGVALAAGLLGTQATVFMPEGAPLPKVSATKGYGAAVEYAGTSVDDALEAAHDFAATTGAVLIHPFDHADVIAGQGTVALEILEQRPEVTTIVTAVGGGGLISGVAVAAKALRPDIRIVGVQAAGAAAYPVSLEAGAPRKLDACATIADGIAVRRPGDLPFAHVAKLVDEIVTVQDEDLSAALLVLLERHKTVVEPAGAAAVAALLTGAYVPLDGPVVAILSGGNIDPMLLMRVIEHGLASAGRFLRLAVRCTDRPGQLARLLREIAGQRANVVDVNHSRQSPRLSFGEVEVALSVETRGPAHSSALIKALRDAGYRVALLADTTP
ncbi:threonine dehydratase [Actinoplanes campanulatus]|uniref:threonine ammonia-lyase n=1 Tax=Actinoplanes campanulatus TaxID=113559 RepID=A0A7W5AJT0_9ACTN|nr:MULTISPECIES: threonine ammonia-lyase [Actinoplanes]MBB3097593.1 threonine dehydratase [Actinoplanes campanulatus]GGN27754.1 threonine ammonia-lyase [Actinoplanes campanulatus]GID37944.1 threonine ammonia-lyase [Actinoplanes campanulatus]GID45740.1 threonine ammonia-lyase [Actinoplanes capillaceus]